MSESRAESTGGGAAGARPGEPPPAAAGAESTGGGAAGARPGEPPPAAAGAENEALVEELRKAKVADLLVHACSLLASLAFGKLAPEVRDLEQARLAIDALQALLPVLPEEPRRDVRQVVSNLQLAYAEAAGS